MRGKCKSIKLTNFKRNRSNIQFELEILEFMIFLLKTVSKLFHWKGLDAMSTPVPSVWSPNVLSFWKEPALLKVQVWEKKIFGDPRI